MIKLIWSCFFMVLPCISLFAQDPKFSQYFASPLTLNPALIGYFDGDYRLAMNTRKQWANVGDPYNTVSLSGEYKLNDEYYYEDVFTLGGNVLFEEAFNKLLVTRVAGIGFSYYRFFDADHRFKLGLAPQISYISKSLDYNRLTFASQYENGLFNTGLPNYLDADVSSISYLDVNIGGNLAMSLEHVKVSLGYSAYHIARPNESFNKNYLGKISIRHTFIFGFRYLTNDLLDVSLTAHHMKQGSSNDDIVGGVLGFKPTYDSKLKMNFGLWHKWNERAFFPFVGFEISNYAVGLNYTVSSNRVNNIQPRTMELSLIITDKDFVKFKNTCKF